MHFFNEKVAEELGVNAAIIFQNIGYWEEHNRNNNMHLHDGKYWTYNSNAAFQKQFSYLGKKAIQTAIEKLKESGYILIGNYNDNTWDHTSWYTLTEKGQSIYQNETIDGAKRDNRQTEKEQSYNNNYNNSEETNRNTDGKTDKKEAKKKKPKRSELPLKVYGEQENILLTEEEYNRLVKDYGISKTNLAIDYLSNYMVEMRYHSENHNLTLRRWVFGAIEKQQMRPQQYGIQETVTERFKFDDEV